MVPIEKHRKLSIKKEGAQISKKMAEELLLRDEDYRTPNKNGSNSGGCRPRRLDE